jgi:plasmid stability protein
LHDGFLEVAMASLTLKNLPDDLLCALREAADRDRRSVTQEIIHLLEVVLRGGERPDVRPIVRSATAEAQVAAWRKLAGTWETEIDPRAEAERIIERRTAGREVDL